MTIKPHTKPHVTHVILAHVSPRPSNHLTPPTSASEHLRPAGLRCLATGARRGLPRRGCRQGAGCGAMLARTLEQAEGRKGHAHGGRTRVWLWYGQRCFVWGYGRAKCDTVDKFMIAPFKGYNYSM